MVILSESLAITGEWWATIIHWKFNMSIEGDVCRAGLRAVLAGERHRCGRALGQPRSPWQGTGDGERLFVTACIASRPCSCEKQLKKGVSQIDLIKKGKTPPPKQYPTMNQCSLWSWGCPSACRMRREPWRILSRTLCSPHKSRSPPNRSVTPPVFRTHKPHLVKINR